MAKKTNSVMVRVINRVIVRLSFKLSDIDINKNTKYYRMFWPACPKIFQPGIFVEELLMGERSWGKKREKLHIQSFVVVLDLFVFVLFSFSKTHTIGEIIRTLV